MKVTNMKASSGNAVPDQFIIEDQNIAVFQSYDSVIVRKDYNVEQPEDGTLRGPTVYLDRDIWNYSQTTAKYRNQFLGETTKETQAKIDSGEYQLVDLN